MDVDIGASSVAASITNMVVGATKSLTLDMGVLLEGQTPATLPEQLLGTIRSVSMSGRRCCILQRRCHKSHDCAETGTCHNKA